MVVHSESDDPSRFARGSRMRAGERELEVEGSRSSGEVLVVRFAGISDRDTAESLRGLELTISEGDRRTLDSDEFWPDELVGLEARLPSGHTVGSIVGFVTGGAQDRLVLRLPGGEVEVPFVDEIVPRIEVDEGFLVLHPPMGLLDV